MDRAKVKAIREKIQEAIAPVLEELNLAHDVHSLNASFKAPPEITAKR